MSETDYINQIAKELNIVNLQGVYSNESELIALIRNIPLLYDKSHVDFRNGTKREESWQAIAAIFNTNKDDVLNRWKTLRDHYNKYKDKSTKEYIQELDFLRDHIIPRRNKFLGECKITSSSIEESNDLSNMDESLTRTTEGRGIQFINIVKSLPIIYTREHPKYKNKAAKLMAWNQVAKEFGHSVDYCRNYWKNLRDSWSRQSRKALETGESKNTEWYQHMSFLGPHVLRRRSTLNKLKKRPVNTFTSSISNLSLPAGNSLDYSVNETNFKFTTDNSSYDDGLTNASADFTFVATSKIENIQDSTEDGSFLLSSSDYEVMEVNELEPNSSLNVENTNSDVSTSTRFSEDDIFGQSIAAELKTIPSSKKKIKLKADIYRLLYEAMDG